MVGKKTKFAGERKMGSRNAKRVDEMERLRRIEREEVRKRMEEIHRRLRITEEAIHRLNSLLTTENNFSETTQPGVVSQEMKREATELIGTLDIIKISGSYVEEAPRCVI